jgi:hypothetical protein
MDFLKNKNKSKTIKQYSNPVEVFRRSRKYLGKTVKIGLSTKRDKKYMITTPDGNTVHFGAMGYEDDDDDGDG